MRRTVLALSALLLLAGCGGGEDEPSSGPASALPRGQVDRPDGVAVDLPAGWHLAKRPLTAVIDPREVLSASTFPLPRRHGPCLHMPASAVAAIGPDDALVTIFERTGSDPASYPPRPNRFSFEPDNGIECVSRPGVRASWTPFRDEGRAFYALLVLGTQASEREAVRVLNSFRPTTPLTVAHLPEGCQPARVESLLDGFLGALNRDDRAAALRYIAPNPELIGFFVARGRGAEAHTVEARTPADAYRALDDVRGRDAFTILGAMVGPGAPFASDDRYPELDGLRLAGFDFVFGLGKRSASGKAGFDCATGRIYVMPVSVARGLRPPGQQLCGTRLRLDSSEPAVCAYPPA
jgi:hypothetical protein